MLKRVLFLLIAICMMLTVGCTGAGKNTVVGDWTAVSIECEEEDLKNDVAMGNIKVTLSVTENAMVITANKHQDPPVKYAYDGKAFTFEHKDYSAKLVDGILVLDVTIADHVYSYHFMKNE